MLLILATQIVFSEEAHPKTLQLTVYPDGFVSVDYKFVVNSTFPTYNLTVFGQVLENLIVTDAEGLPLGYVKNGSVLSVYSLGTNEIRITYLTNDLTSKQGRYWNLTLVAPINTSIILPEETVIISLNKVPEIIETNGDRVMLLMNDGFIEVTYIVGIVGTKEHAQIVINDAEQVIAEIKSFGINVTEAEMKLQQAEDAFSLGNYAEAETLGNEAKNMAVQINQTAVQAQSKIEEAEGEIAKSQTEMRIVGLSDAQDLLNKAKNEYNIGNYSEALSLATQSITMAEEAEVFMSEKKDFLNFPFLELVGALLVSAITVFGFLFFWSKKKALPKKSRRIDGARILREHKDLMPDEKQAVQFLVENNGEAFEAELYDYVKLPRTTTWRMVKRLKRMGIITVTKFRRQNLVRLKTKYDFEE